MMAYSYADEKHLISKELFEEKMDAVIAAASSYPVDDTWQATGTVVQPNLVFEVLKGFATETEMYEYVGLIRDAFLKFGYFTVIATVTSSDLSRMPVGAKASLSLQSFQQMPNGEGALWTATLKAYLPGGAVLEQTSLLSEHTDDGYYISARFEFDS